MNFLQIFLLLLNHIFVLPEHLWYQLLTKSSHHNVITEVDHHAFIWWVNNQDYICRESWKTGEMALLQGSTERKCYCKIEKFQPALTTILPSKYLFSHKSQTPIKNSSIFFFLTVLGIELRAHDCQTGVLSLEPHSSSSSAFLNMNDIYPRGEDSSKLLSFLSK